MDPTRFPETSHQNAAASSSAEVSNASKETNTQKTQDLAKTSPFAKNEALKFKSSVSLTPNVQRPLKTVKSERTRLETECPALAGKYVPHIRPSSIMPFEMVKQRLEQTGDQENPLILIRGCSAKRLKALATTSTAGGEPPMHSVTKPTEAEALAQVNESGHLPEFTCREGVAAGFGRGRFIIAIKIDARYLTQGSVSEKGFVAYPGAPVELLAWTEGEPALNTKSSNMQPLTHTLDSGRILREVRQAGPQRPQRGG